MNDSDLHTLFRRCAGTGCPVCKAKMKPVASEVVGGTDLVINTINTRIVLEFNCGYCGHCEEFSFDVTELERETDD